MNTATPSPEDGAVHSQQVITQELQRLTTVMETQRAQAIRTSWWTKLVAVLVGCLMLCYTGVVHYLTIANHKRVMTSTEHMTALEVDIAAMNTRLDVNEKHIAQMPMMTHTIEEMNAKLDQLLDRFK